jgi:hypothetical protein
MSLGASGSHETLGIGLNERGKFNSAPEAKVRVFMPRPHEGVFELSSYALDDLDEPQIWELLDRHLNKGALARVELTPAHVLSADLQVDPNWDPERHVNIVGWPSEEHEQKSRAQVLHACQRCIRR